MGGVLLPRTLYRTGGRVMGWLALLGLWLIIIQGAWTSTRTLWPGLHEDGSYYATIPINLANGLGNTLSVHARALQSAESFKSLLSAIHWVNFVCLFLAVSFYFLQTKRLFNASHLFSFWVATGFSTATIGTMHYLQGRPEHGMVAFLLLAGLVGEFRWKSLWPNWFHGVVIGVSASFSPLPGALWAIGTMAALTWQSIQPIRLIAATITRLTFAVTTWSLLNLFLSPEPIIQIISITLERGRHTQTLTYLPKSTGLYFLLDWWIHWFSPYWITLSYAPGLIFSFGMAAVLATGKIIQSFRWQRSLIIRSALFTYSAVMAYQIFHNSIEKPGAHYNLLPLLPGIFSWLLAGISTLPKIKTLKIMIQEKSVSEKTEWKELTIYSKLYQSWIPLLMLISCTLPGIGYLRFNITQPEILRKGVSYDEAHKKYQELKSQLASDEYILVDEITNANSKSAVIFDIPPWKTIAYNGDIDSLERKFSIKIKFFFDLQERLKEPEHRNGFRLIEKKFNSTPVMWKGMVVRSVIPSYGYAVYEREMN